MHATRFLFLQLALMTLCFGRGRVSELSSIDLQDSEMYDCHPAVYSKRLGIECDLEGDENAFLLTVAVARCRMPEEWAPNWKCKNSNVREVRKCLEQTIDEMVFATLVEICYEVFEYCMNKVSADSIYMMSDMADQLNRATAENRRLQEEQARLVEEASKEAAESDSLLQQSFAAVHALLDTRHLTSRLIKDVSQLFTTFTAVEQAIDGASNELVPPGENADKGSGKSTLEDELKRLRHELVGKAKWRADRRRSVITERTVTIIYFWTAVLILLSTRRSRAVDFLYDLCLFVIIFFLSGWLRSIILRLAFRIFCFLLYIFVPRDSE